MNALTHKFIRRWAREREMNLQEIKELNKFSSAAAANSAMEKAGFTQISPSFDFCPAFALESPFYSHCEVTKVPFVNCPLNLKS